MARREVLPSALRGSLPSALTCSCGSETADSVATAQGLGTQGLRAGRPGVLNSTTAAVSIIEPQHMLRNLVVRRQVRTRVTTCRAVVCPSPAGLREVQARSLSLRQVQAKAAQPQTQEPTRPGHCELPLSRHASSASGALGRRRIRRQSSGSVPAVELVPLPGAAGAGPRGPAGGL